jgi:hypothetical protein
VSIYFACSVHEKKKKRKGEIDRENNKKIKKVILFKLLSPVRFRARARSWFV